MAKLKQCLGFLIILVCLCCTKQLCAQDSLKIYADPETITGLKASKFIENMDFLPLETSKEAMYQPGSNYQLAGQVIVVHDHVDNTLFLFDKNSGKLLHKFKNDKRKYEITNVHYVPEKNALLIRSRNKHYTISEKKSQQLTLRWQDRDITKYVQLQWLYLEDHFRVETMPAPAMALNNDLFYYNGGFIYRNYKTDKYKKDSILFRLVQYDADGHVRHRYFPFLNLRGLWSDYYAYQLPIYENATLEKGSLLTQLDFNPTIYELRADTLIEKYQFVFPIANVMPADFGSLSFKNNIDYQKYKDKNTEAFSNFYRIFEHGKYLFFSSSSVAARDRNFLYFDKVLYDYSKVITDSTIHNLPPSMIAGLFGQDSNYLYVAGRAELFLPHKQALLKDERISQAFKDYLEDMTKDDNYIIIRIQLKSPY